MSKVISFSANETTIEFLGQFKGENRSRLINQALDILRKAKLRRELEAAGAAQDEEDLAWANADLDDYLEMIDRDWPRWSNLIFIGVTLNRF